VGQAAEMHAEVTRTGAIDGETVISSTTDVVEVGAMTGTEGTSIVIGHAIEMT
jgi:hypothetical protein